MAGMRLSQFGGWLSKALTLLRRAEYSLIKVELANALGGVNMKSIEHWLLAAKLVTKIPRAREEKKKLFN